MLYVLVYHGVEGAVDNEYPEGTSEAKKKRLNKKAYHMLLLHLFDDVMTNIASSKTVSELYTALETNYLKK